MSGKPHHWRFYVTRHYLPAILLLVIAVFLWPAHELGSNFVFYLPGGHQLIPVETVGGAKYLPLLPILNAVGKVGGIQEKKGSLKVWFGSTQIEVKENETRVRIEEVAYDLPRPVSFSGGQWMVPVEFLTTALPHLTRQTVEYQEGTDRIFLGDVKPASFSVRLDPLANGARVAVQFTEKVTVHTSSTDGKWVIFLGAQPIEPMESSYHFQNPYVSDLQFDDQDGEPKLILSSGSHGLNFLPSVAEGGKILLADVTTGPNPSAQANPPQPGQAVPPPMGQAAAATSTGAPIPLPPLVALDAGHGGSDEGGRSRDGVLEKDLTAQYVARVRAALLASGKYRVMMTRGAEANVSFEQRAVAANMAGAICFLSFHAGDLGAAPRRIAVFTFVPPLAAPAAANSSTLILWNQVQEARLTQSRQLAAALQQQFALISGAQAPPPATAPVRTLRSVNAAAVAIELGRFAADNDATVLADPAFQQQVAAAIVPALDAFQNGGNRP